MANLNEILIEGNLVRDSQVRIANGHQVANITIAYDSFFKKADGVVMSESHFFDIEVWGSDAAAKLKKGNRVNVIGSLRQDRWTDQAGVRHSRVKIVAKDIALTSRVVA